MAKEKKRFEYKLSLGKHPISGEVIRRSFYSTKSLRDAKKKAEAFQRDYEMEMMVEGSSVIRNEKFSTWARSCLVTYKKPYVKANTYAGTYLAPVETHLIPYFGEMRIGDIKPVHIQRYINEAATKYAPETIKKDFNCLKLIFDTAVDNQLCVKSPMTRSIKLPRYETVKDKHAFTQAQYDVAYAAAQEYGDLSLALMLETGLSRSELPGLRWEDIDEENRCLRVTQGLVVYHDVEVDRQVMCSDGLKNKFRKRTLPITDDTLWLRLTQTPQTVKMGGKEIRTEYIIHSPEGKPYNPNNWANRVFRPFMQRLHREHPDIPELSPHELRHTRATLWIAQGIDPYMVARLLGHSDLKMLTKIYDHTSTETLRKALLGARPAAEAKKESRNGSPFRCFLRCFLKNCHIFVVQPFPVLENASKKL